VPTQRLVVCERCGPSPATGSTLFEDLLAKALGETRQCTECHAHHVELRLKFSFGLNASDPECTVRDCFMPRHPERWRDADGKEVTFHPFLVVLQRHGREQAAWLPYWHTVERPGRKRAQKYGQWAPLMDFSLFEDLLSQARAKGYLLGGLLGPAACGQYDAGPG